MLRLLGFLVALLLLVALVGYFRGWFHAESQDANGSHSVTVSVDNDKLNQDKAKARQEVQTLTHNK